MTHIDLPVTRRDLIIAAAVAAGAGVPVPAGAAAPPITGTPRDFDFLHGRWTVRHRRLKAFLARSTEWIECEGTMACWPTLGGFGNVDDNLIRLPDGDYPAMSVRAYDTATRQWSIWWLDGRNPGAGFGAPVRGGFKGGIGIFMSKGPYKGQEVTTRFRWTQFSVRSVRWEQAASVDDGVNWETSWIMDLARDGRSG